MIHRGRNKTWRKTQKQQFGERLVWARIRAGFNTGSSALTVLNDIQQVARRTYYSHEAGEKLPDDNETIDLYCRTFNISREFLISGTGPEAEEFAVNLNDPDGGRINQANEAVRAGTSHFHNIRYITVLTADEVRLVLKGEGGSAIMSSDQLPAPAHIDASPQAYAYQVSKSDRSMVGGGPRSFHPGDHLIIDPLRITMPGDFMLVWLQGWSEPVLRQLQSARPFDPADPHYDFTLVALNPSFESVKVRSPQDVKICGRLIYSAQSY